MSSIGERIKQARRANGYTLRKLAEQVGVSHQAISKYENSEDIPSSDVLVRLGESLKVKLDYFFRKNTVTVEKPRFRKHKSLLPRKEERSILSCVAENSERYLDIERSFKNDTIERFSFPTSVNCRVSTMEDVESRAEQLRIAWGIGLDAIENVVHLLEDKGIKIIALKTHDEFDALSYMANDMPVIVIRDGVHGDRQRFSLCHELGHLFLKPDKKIDEEKTANRFSGAFLVPAQTVYFELGEKRRFIDPNELLILKKKYGMSMQAWIYRARDLDIISQSVANRIFALFRKNKWHITEPGEQISSEKPERMELLVWKALGEDFISESRAAELLGKSLYQFRKEAAGGKKRISYS